MKSEKKWVSLERCVGRKLFLYHESQAGDGKPTRHRRLMAIRARVSYWRKNEKASGVISADQVMSGDKLLERTVKGELNPMTKVQQVQRLGERKKNLASVRGDQRDNRVVIRSIDLAKLSYPARRKKLAVGAINWVWKLKKT